MMRMKVSEQRLERAALVRMERKHAGRWYERVGDDAYESE